MGIILIGIIIFLFFSYINKQPKGVLLELVSNKSIFGPLSQLDIELIKKMNIYGNNSKYTKREIIIFKRFILLDIFYTVRNKGVMQKDCEIIIKDIDLFFQKKYSYELGGFGKKQILERFKFYTESLGKFNEDNSDFTSEEVLDLFEKGDLGGFSINPIMSLYVKNYILSIIIAKNELINIYIKLDNN
ncbi:MAG: hypothetical protein PHV23_05740 [Candidatus Gracilibacteria bacterium]|nr:hypothetical protein [Candidatus Gracilibacteria bacterium]